MCVSATCTFECILDFCLDLNVEDFLWLWDIPEVLSASPITRYLISVGGSGFISENLTRRHEREILGAGVGAM